MTTRDTVNSKASNETAGGKRPYERMRFSPIAIEARQCILAGSNTGENIEIQRVTVKTFDDDPSFPTGGFEANFD